MEAQPDGRLESFKRWYEYSKARDMMLEATDSKHAPWHILRSDDKQRARLNGIAHILNVIPYKKTSQAEGQVARSGRQMSGYDDQAALKNRRFAVERF